VHETATDLAERRRPRPTLRPRRRDHASLQAAIFAGGIAGGLARAGLDRLLPADGRGWPWATFLANLAGAFLLGYLATRLLERLPPSTYRRPLLGTGFCGALTTFSTLQIELIRLARNGHLALALLYLGASVGGGLSVFSLATALARRLRRP
jgi:CrcB protein